MNAAPLPAGLSGLMEMRDRAMLEVLYSTGIRNAEIRALKVYDLDFDRGLLRINEGKNAKDRVVPLGKPACEFLATHMLQGRADIRYIQAMLGHSSVATTQIYTRVGVPDLKAVHRRCHPRERRS